LFELERIDHIAITVADLDYSVKWYKENLGLENYYAAEWEGVPVMLGKGGTCLALFTSKKSSEQNTENKPAHIRHIAFRADRKNFEEAKRILSERNIEFRQADHGISHSIYITDPDGYRIEITTYQITGTN